MKQYEDYIGLFMIIMFGKVKRWSWQKDYGRKISHKAISELIINVLSADAASVKVSLVIELLLLMLENDDNKYDESSCWESIGCIQADFVNIMIVNKFKV